MKQVSGAQARYQHELTNRLSAIQGASAMQRVLKDLITPAELRDMATRIQIVKLLQRGMTQRDVAQQLHVSITKVMRGAAALRQSTGGFALLLK